MKLIHAFMVVLPVLALTLVGDEHAFAHSPPSKWESPSHQYALVISDTSEPYSYRLSLFHRGKELSHYAFNDHLTSIYWSPDERFVAFNNHYGHRAWAIWIISLEDGGVIRASGEIKSTTYDMYEDFASLPDVVALAKSKIMAVYPNYLNDQDRRGLGHVTVIYGWKDKATLLMYDELGLDDLYEKENCYLSIYSLLQVRRKGLSSTPLLVEKTTDFASDKRPKEVVDVLGY